MTLSELSEEIGWAKIITYIHPFLLLYATIVLVTYLCLLNQKKKKKRKKKLILTVMSQGKSL